MSSHIAKYKYIVPALIINMTLSIWSYRWRGSVYKLVWRELLAYLALYYLINLTYRYGLNDEQKQVFQTIRQYFGQHNESIPMSFVLGFYVSLVVKRWWEQYRMLPWPDTLALFISAAIPGNKLQDETGRLMRRNIMRYMVLSYVITLQRISLRVKRRFPTWQHVVDAGLMLESERKIFEMMDSKSPMSKYWMPLVWATNIINRARKEGLITSDHIVQTLLMELSDIRRRLGGLIGYDTVCVPLVYTQVVTLVLYTYFAAALLGHDDDIELNWLIDRHIKASYMIVDEMHEEHPELLKDQYWEEVVPKDLPYTVASEHYRKDEPKGSAEQYKVKETDAVYANIVTRRQRSIHDAEGYADYESVDTPMAERRKNWFSRQITRMGSARSASTAYSSGGLFGRNRHNSVYSSPEAGLPPGSAQQIQASQKMSLYDKFVGRKSLRAQRQLMKQTSKQSINGSISKLKARPRIPTPDVTKDVLNERERNSFSNNDSSNSQNSSSVTGSVGIISQQLATNPSVYPSMRPSDVPVVGTLLLSPIKEMESASVNSTLQANHPTTAALAKSILPAALKSAGIGTGNTALTSISLPLTTSRNEKSDKNPIIVLPAVSTSSDSSYFVIPSSSANTNNNSKTDYSDKPLAITTMFSTPKSDLSEDMTTTVVTTFPIHKSSSFSKLQTHDDSSEDNSNFSKSLEIESQQISDDTKRHSVSAPGSKTNTLTKHEVYV
uniref:Bestrophin homolog n=1 Tax=Culicoides sonorensis TaxID=179676 RepID=A0A336LX87_CULSO